MRRFLSISLIVLFMLPLVMPLFALAADADANLPVCCRRHGGHRCHCSMMMAYLWSHTPGTHVQPTPHPCDGFTIAVTPSGNHDFVIDIAAQIFAGLISHPSIQPQTEARARVSGFCARQKRGPPATQNS